MMIHADLPDGQDLQQGWKLSTANNLVYDTLWSGFLTNVNVTIVSSKFWEPISLTILRQQRREIRQWNGICQTSPNIHFLIIDFYEILRNGEKKSGIPGKIWTNLFPDLIRNEFWGYFWHSKIELELVINIRHGPKHQNTAIAISCTKCTFGEYF